MYGRDRHQNMRLQIRSTGHGVSNAPFRQIGLPSVARELGDFSDAPKAYPQTHKSCWIMEKTPGKCLQLHQSKSYKKPMTS